MMFSLTSLMRVMPYQIKEILSDGQPTEDPTIDIVEQLDGELPSRTQEEDYIKLKAMQIGKYLQVIRKEINTR